MNSLSELIGLLVVVVILLVALGESAWGLFRCIVVFLGLFCGIGDYLIPLAMFLTLAFVVAVFFIDP